MEYGKQVIITEEVQYIGNGEDPKDNIGFQIWEKAYLQVHGQPERSKREDPTNFYPSMMAHQKKIDDKIINEMLGCGALNSMET